MTSKGPDVTERALRLLTALVPAVLLAAGPVACASTPSEEQVAYDRNVISEPEIRALEERASALQVVRRLRPAWLQGRGQTRIAATPDEVVVYINNQRAGGPAVLERWASTEIRELHFLDAIAATQRFGTGHVSGAIIVVLR
jgi:hypothetical protein